MPSWIELAKCASLQDEFWAHVSPQDALPITPGGDAQDNQNLDVLLPPELLTVAATCRDDEFVDLLTTHLLRNPKVVHGLRLLVGITDKRFYLDMSYSLSRALDPTSLQKTLCGCLPHELTRHQTSSILNMLHATASRSEAVVQATAHLVAEYFHAKGLLSMLRLFATLGKEQRAVLDATLVTPKESQQADAKRRGHGLEAALASLLTELHVDFLPASKATNPLGEPDPNLDPTTLTVVKRDQERTFSVDLVIQQNGHTRVCVLGLVHSSDPGEYGARKAATTIDIHQHISRYNDRMGAHEVDLWGLVDGVGYSENKAGTINVMLPHFDTFIQLNSLYKAALRLHAIGACHIRTIRFDEDHYAGECLRQMIAKYVTPLNVPVLTVGDPDPSPPIAAGWAKVYVE